MMTEIAPMIITVKYAFPFRWFKFNQPQPPAVIPSAVADQPVVAVPALISSIKFAGTVVATDVLYEKAIPWISVAIPTIPPARSLTRYARAKLYPQEKAKTNPATASVPFQTNPLILIISRITGIVLAS